MQSLAPVLLLVLGFIGVVEGADSHVAPGPRADCSFEAAASYEKELIDRIAILERKLDEATTARLAERAAAGSSLATARKEMAARLETMSGELRVRELELNRSTESLKNLRASVTECSESLEIARKKGSDLETRRTATESALRDAEATRREAVTSAKTAAADAAEQRASAARASARADELERRLSDATERIATLEKDLSASKEAARVAGIETQKARSDSRREVAALRAAVTSRTSENALLAKQLDEQKALQSSIKSVASERDSLVKDLAKARAEIARLNDVNIEQQALIDGTSGGEAAGDYVAPRKASPKEERRESATRARNAPPLLAGRDPGSPSRPAHESRPDDLAKALARRDEIQHAIERLKGSPADQGAPAKAVELEAALDSLNLEIRRLTVVLGDADVSSP